MDKNKIIELLPWYANNSLDEEETRMVNEALKNDDELKKEYELFISLSSNIKSNQKPSPGEIGLARLKRGIKASQSTGGHTAKGWKLAAIAASLVIVVQIGVILNQNSEPQYYRPLDGGNILANTIGVSISSAATEQQIRDTLVNSGAVIIDGPSAAGIYRLRSTTEIDTTIQSLQAYPEVITHIQTD